MVETLNTRYPIDTFKVEKVRLSLIPLGTTAKATAVNSKTEFDVSYIIRFVQDSEIKDNLYDVRTETHFRNEFKDFLNVNRDWIEGMEIESVSKAEVTMNTQRGTYPVRVKLLLAKEISSTEQFIAASSYLAKELKANPKEGVSAYRFFSFPGSITEKSAMSLALDSNNLTEPTMEPTPSPTPNPRSTVATSAHETMTSTTAESTSEEKTNPLFVLELNLLSNALDASENLIHNGIRQRALTEKELNVLVENYKLDSDAAKLIDKAYKRQRRDETKKGETTRTEMSFAPTKGSVKK